MKRVSLLVALWLSAGTMAAESAPELEALKASFAEALRPADRVVIRSGPSGAVGPGLEVVFDWTDRDGVQGLAELFEPTKIEGYCMCLGDVLVEFYRGPDYVFSFSVHHNLLLRGDGIPWGGDLQFEPEKIARFLRGFEAIGYHGFAEEMDTQRMAEAVADAEWNSYLEFFPPAARPFVPRGLVLEERFGGMPKAAEFREAMGRSPVTVLTLWRAIGEWSRRHGLGSYLPHPLNALLDAIDHLPVEVQREALATIQQDSDPLVRAGAGVSLLLSRSRLQRWEAPVSEELLARLSVDVFALSRDHWDETRVVDALVESGGRRGQQVLLKRLIDLPDLKETSSDECPDDVRSNRFIALVLTLTQAGASEAIPVFERLLPSHPDGGERLALDIGIATLDPAQSARVGFSHLLCEREDLRDAALKVILKDERPVPLEVLVELAREIIPALDAPENEFLGADSAKAWARRRLAAMGVKALPIHEESKTSELELEAAQRLKVGAYDEAHEIYRDLPLLLNTQLKPLKAMLGSGRMAEAADGGRLLVLDAVKDRRSETSLPDLLLFRGSCYYALGWFEAAAADFAATALLEESDREWSISLQYLALAHLGREREAILVDWQAMDWDGQGPTLGWPNAAALHLKGEIDEVTMLEEIGAFRAKKYPVDLERLTRAHWLLAEKARLVGDEKTEREHLAEVLQLAHHEDVFHILARLRERELRWAREG